MSVTCPNCGQKTYIDKCRHCHSSLLNDGVCPNCHRINIATDCQWCHYPLIAKPAGNFRVREQAERKQRPLPRIITGIITSFLIIIIGVTGFICITPDYNIYMVQSESMKPAINLGDLIVTGPEDNIFSKGIAAGTIVTYQHRKDTITHRVISIEPDHLVVKGDAAEEPDPWKVTMSDIKGVYLFKVPYLGYLLDFIRTKLGWFVVIILPASLLVLLIIKEILKETFRSDNVQAINGGNQ